MHVVKPPTFVTFPSRSGIQFPLDAVVAMAQEAGRMIGLPTHLDRLLSGHQIPSPHRPAAVRELWAGLALSGSTVPSIDQVSPVLSALREEKGPRSLLLEIILYQDTGALTLLEERTKRDRTYLWASSNLRLLLEAIRDLEDPGLIERLGALLESVFEACPGLFNQRFDDLLRSGAVKSLHVRSVRQGMRSVLRGGFPSDAVRGRQASWERHKDLLQAPDLEVLITADDINFRRMGHTMPDSFAQERAEERDLVALARVVHDKAGQERLSHDLQVFLQRADDDRGRCHRLWQIVHTREEALLALLREMDCQWLIDLAQNESLAGEILHQLASLGNRGALEGLVRLAGASTDYSRIARDLLDRIEVRDLSLVASRDADETAAEDLFRLSLQGREDAVYVLGRTVQREFDGQDLSRVGWRALESLAQMTTAHRHLGAMECILRFDPAFQSYLIARRSGPTIPVSVRDFFLGLNFFLRELILRGYLEAVNLLHLVSETDPEARTLFLSMASSMPEVVVEDTVRITGRPVDDRECLEIQERQRRKRVRQQILTYAERLQREEGT